jgi:hypothetical protein
VGPRASLDAVEVHLHLFVNLELDGGEWSDSRIGHFTPEVRAPGTPLIGGWVGSRASLDAVEIYLHTFVTLALDGGEWSDLRLGHFTPGVRAPDTHFIRG